MEDNDCELPQQVPAAEGVTSGNDTPSSKFTSRVGVQLSRQKTAGSIPTLQVEPNVAKATRARKPVMSILICLIFASSSMLFVNTGLQGVSGVLQGRYTAIGAELNMAQDQIKRQNLISERLDELIIAELPISSIESHAQCLVRGVHVANIHFFPWHFYEIPSVRNQTEAWVEDNCAKIHFLPVVVPPHVEPANLSAWTRVSHGVQDLLKAAKTKANKLDLWFRTKLWSKIIPIGSNLLKDARVPSDEPYLLPRHYQLVGCETPPCHLAYEPLADHLLYTLSSKKKSANVLNKEFYSLSNILAWVLRASDITWGIIMCLLVVQTILVTFLVDLGIEDYQNSRVIIHFWRQRTFSPFWNNLDRLTRQVSGLTAAFVGFIIPGYFASVRYGLHVPLLVHVLNELTGLIGIIAFTSVFVNSRRVPNVSRLAREIKELIALAKERPATNGQTCIRERSSLLHTTLQEDLAEEVQVRRATTDLETTVQPPRTVIMSTTSISIPENLFQTSRIERNATDNIFSEQTASENIELHTTADSDTDSSWSVVGGI